MKLARSLFLIAALVAVSAYPLTAQVNTGSAGLKISLDNPFTSPLHQDYATLGKGVPVQYVAFDTTAGDSVPLRTILRTGGTGGNPGPGIYDVIVSLMVTDSATAGKSFGIVTSYNGFTTIIDSTAALGDSLKKGTVVDLRVTRYVQDSIVFRTAGHQTGANHLVATHVRIAHRG